MHDNGDQRLHVAADTVTITPPTPYPLAGYGARTAFTEIHDELEANAVLLSDGSSAIVMLSADLLYIGDELRQAVAAGLHPSLRNATILFAATHTHFAPMTQTGMPEVGIASAGYVQYVAPLIAGLVNSLAERLEPAGLRYGEITADHSTNRRLVRWRLWSRGITKECGMGPNPAGPRDENVRLLRLTRADGRDRAVVWNYTCHPTGFPNHDCVTAEYPGVVRESLRQACSARDLPVLCLQGYCGDVRPPFVAPVKGFVSLARRICVGPGLSHGTTEQWANWAKSLAAKVCAAHSSATTLPFNGRLASASAVVPMKELATGADPGTGLGITSISLGDELRLVALDAEPVAAYREIVEGVFPGERLMTVGYTNRVFGYLPVDSMLPQGGYEVAGFRTPFRFSGTFRPGIDETVRGALLRIKQSG